MSDEAIQTDVSEEPQVQLTRQDKLEAIAEAAYAEPEETVEEVVEETVEEVVEEEEEEVVEEPEEEPEKAEEETENDDIVTLKVDGREEKVSRDKVLEAGKRAMQKESTADRRLEEAARERRELEELRKQFEEQQKAAKVKDEPETFGKEVVESLFDNEEQAAEKLNEVARQAREAKAAAAEASQALAELRAEQARKAEAEEKAVVEHYHSSYKDIASDEDMHNALVRRVTIYQEEEPSLSGQQLIDKAAKEVYERFGVPDKQSAQKVKESMPKQAKKASARIPAEKEEKPKTMLDIISDMKVARGRPALQ